ncbi:hypothetical protein ACFYMI_11775 [Streptomyces collinus]|uniref:hypothetical protein n=1 Tax=Streptomyces collinus TaxID=42684 RepID=UPI00367CF3B1
MTAAAANVCGSGYTISAGAARYGANASLYLWWNGKYSGSNKLYDKYICGVLREQGRRRQHLHDVRMQLT